MKIFVFLCYHFIITKFFFHFYFSSLSWSFNLSNLTAAISCKKNKVCTGCSEYIALILYLSRCLRCLCSLIRRILYTCKLNCLHSNPQVGQNFPQTLYFPLKSYLHTLSSSKLWPWWLPALWMLNGSETSQWVLRTVCRLLFGRSG